MDYNFNGKTPIYVIGYPKSGNTWLTRLIGEILNSKTESGYLNVKGDIACEGENRKGNYVILKSHYSKYDKPAFITKESKILYIVRDFRDVIVSSFFHHHKIDENLVLNSSNTSTILLKRILWRFVFYIEALKIIHSWSSLFTGALIFQIFYNNLIIRFIRNKFKKGKVGNWSDHIIFWKNFSKNVIVIRYEDLLKTPKFVIENALNNIKVEFDPENIKKSIDNQSFEKRKKEFIEKKDAVNYKFLRKGKSGDWKQFLSNSLVKKVIRKHKEVMSMYNYI